QAGTGSGQQEGCQCKGSPDTAQRALHGATCADHTVAPRALQLAQQEQDEQNHQQGTDNTTGGVPPLAAVGPAGNNSKQQQYHNNQQQCSYTQHLSPGSTFGNSATGLWVRLLQTTGDGRWGLYAGTHSGGRCGSRQDQCRRPHCN